MSKKRRRYQKKHHKKKTFVCTCQDRHHLFWTRTEYAKHFWANKLRLHEYCIVPIPKSTLHREIHHEVRWVPIPREEICKQTYEELERLRSFGVLKEDNIIKRLNLLIFILEYAADDTTDALKKQLEIATRFYKKSG